MITIYDKIKESPESAVSIIHALVNIVDENWRNILKENNIPFQVIDVSEEIHLKSLYNFLMSDFDDIMNGTDNDRGTIFI